MSTAEFYAMTIEPKRCYLYTLWDIGIHLLNPYIIGTV